MSWRCFFFVLVDFVSKLWCEIAVLAILPALALVGSGMYAWLAYEYSTTPDHNTRHTVSAVFFGIMAILGLRGIWSFYWDFTHDLDRDGEDVARSS